MEYVIIRSGISLLAFYDFLPSQISRFGLSARSMTWGGYRTFRNLILVANNDEIIDTTNQSEPLKRIKKKIVSKILSLTSYEINEAFREKWATS